MASPNSLQKNIGDIRDFGKMLVWLTSLDPLSGGFAKLASCR